MAEDEIDDLAEYFVETDQWRRVVAGGVDIVFGAKGAGKSAIYSTLLNRAPEMWERRILFLSAENPRGTPAFKDLVADPPTSEQEFQGLWKLYLLSLLSKVLEDQAAGSPSGNAVLEAMREARLYESAGASLQAMLKRVRDYVRKLTNIEAVEGGVRLDQATGQIAGLTGRISLREPGPDEADAGIRSADGLLRLADTALAEADVHTWVLLDRLDVAFADSLLLEANALRALFKLYLDTVQLQQVHLKIFLRTDIWRQITEGGFREASHVTRQLELSWNDASLLNLLVRRLLRNDPVAEYYAVEPEGVLADAAAQRSFFERLVPDQIDSGRNPKTFEWMLGRVRDGSRLPAPRELIHLASATRDVQLAMLERGEEEPTGEMLLSRQAFRDALPDVSRTRLEQTLFAEYPDLKPAIAALEGEKTDQSGESLATIWQLDPESAMRTAMQLVDIGFFEKRGTRADPDFWVPFLYRPALNMVQGSADSTDDEPLG